MQTKPKRIGIATCYSNNYNYGGQLQSYAMQRVFSMRGWDAKLLSLNERGRRHFFQRLKALGLYHAFVQLLGRLLFKILLLNGKFRARFQTGRQRYNRFMDAIPHTEQYTLETISHCNDDFDAFVCGSDQVWNPGWWNDAFFLAFTQKPRFAYAASIGKTSLTDAECACIREKTAQYLGVSVREKYMCAALRDKLPVPVEFALDPTMLVDREEWRSIAIAPPVKSRYVLIYMVGDSIKHKRRLYRHCKALGYQVVSIDFVRPYLKSLSDGRYCDFSVLDAGPAEWIGWISHADYVFTNSFHASVFSILFHRQFWALERQNPRDPNSKNARLYSLLSLCGIVDRLLHTDAEFLNFERAPLIDFTAVEDAIRPYRRQSWDFIERCLNQVVSE